MNQSAVLPTIVCEDCDEPMQEIMGQTHVDPVFIRGRALSLHGITILRCKCGDVPVFPRIGLLAALVKTATDYSEFYWNADRQEWRTSADHNKHLGGVRGPE